MARTSEEIAEIIAELKAARDTRNDSIESVASSLDSSNSKMAERWRSLKYIKEIANDIEVSVSCKVIKDEYGNPLAMSHTSYWLEDREIGGQIEPGLYTILQDESVNIPISNIVENL